MSECLLVLYYRILQCASKCTHTHTQVYLKWHGSIIIIMLNIKHKNIKKTHKAKQDSENTSVLTMTRVRAKLGLVVIEGIDNERVLESSSFSSLWNIWCV